MNELFPILGGLAVGVTLGALRPRTRIVVGFLAAVVVGGLATVLSGESQVSWGYLLVDIPLAGLSSVAAMFVARRLHGRERGTPPPAAESAGP